MGAPRGVIPTEAGHTFAWTAQAGCPSYISAYPPHSPQDATKEDKKHSHRGSKTLLGSPR